MAAVEETEDDLIDRCQVDPYPERTCTSEFRVVPAEGAQPPISGAMQNAVQVRYWNTEIWYGRSEGQLEIKHTSSVQPGDILQRLQEWGAENQVTFELVEALDSACLRLTLVVLRSCVC
eukprot:CAMPEP_0171098886 /NCGR_PEP_ID=MMETSP0766_2-20121228/49776_1 /TAXON_ID=439317 /ORGANISM="Gambierdiscus australes, Strain CAWD 149" /LENGTH=118 /DNA_ID=CAMNT_0011558357 /DNA_START=54 /DNA_END=408 /DNA_ORIENTATION=+